jgi:DNA mismatch repair protein MutL
MIPVESTWDRYRITGFVSKPTDARPSRTLQTFFVNGRPVRSKTMLAALEEAYRNRIMVGKFPACVLHLELPANAVDVNVHPAKTEVKFLSEKAVFDCIHYGVLAALNRTADRPQVQFKPQPAESNAPAAPSIPVASTPAKAPIPAKEAPKKQDFFRTMTAEEYKTFSAALADPPMPKKEAAIAAAAKIERPANMPLRETVILPQPVAAPAKPQATIPAPSAPAIGQAEVEKAEETEEIQQIALPMPEEIPWRLVGELYQSYIIVEQGEEAFLIDKHAAHERILFEKLKANQESFSSQALLQPIAIRLSPAATAELISNQKLLTELGFELEEFGENTLLLRQIPMDLSPEQAAETVETMASDLLSGRRERSDSVRDEILHTVACKAAIKAGWKNDEAELLALVKQVMADENLKYCPHGRPICITLSKKQLEKQFKRA